jgi:hypothetical protein
MVTPPGAAAGAAQSLLLDAPDIRDVMKGRTLGLARVGSVLVLAHNAEAPAAEEWTRYCQAIATHHAVLTGQLVLAEGVGPDASQRQQMLDGVIAHYPKGTPTPPTAVLTRSLMVRGVVTLFNWFTPRAMRAFAPEDLRDAAAHMKLSEVQLRRLVSIGEALRPAPP